MGLLFGEIDSEFGLHLIEFLLVADPVYIIDCTLVEILVSIDGISQHILSFLQGTGASQNIVEDVIVSFAF